MTNKQSTLIIIFSALIATTIFVVTINRPQHKKKNQVTAAVFESVHGWGYDILVNNELFIHQELIPAVPGNSGFPSKKQAEQAAQLIINKIEKGQLPTVTIFELAPILSFNNMQHDDRGPAK